MELIVFLQSLATSFITFILTIFDFFGQNAFFIVLFSFLFLIVDKNFAYKYFICYFLGFSISSLFLKNIISRPRPYSENSALFSSRNSYSFSCPSFSTTLSSFSSLFLYRSFYNKKNIMTNSNYSKNFLKVFFILILIFFNLFVGIAQLYFAENYLFDVILGFIIGLTIFYFVFKYIKINDKTFNISLIIFFLFSIILFLYFIKDCFDNNFQNSIIFEFCGIVLSTTLGLFIEKKYIKYQIKSNFIFNIFKVLCLVIVLISYYFLSKLFVGNVIFNFLKYFLVGIIITIVMPLFFNFSEKYFYILSPNINKDKIVFSKITFSEKDTNKIARDFSRTLKKGDCILLYGDLGSGKTVFTRQVLRYLGVKQNINSPTFTIVNCYDSFLCKIYHFDMYRLDSEEESFNIGFDEMLEDKNAIKFIEWPEKVFKSLPEKYKKITITKLGKKIRNIVYEEFN